MGYTDTLKGLGKKSGFSTNYVREVAKDLGLHVTYDAKRKRWILKEPPATVNTFKRYLKTRNRLSETYED